MTTDVQTQPTSTMTKAGPRRVLLKLSGEVFGGGKIGVDPEVVRGIARQIAEAIRQGTQVAIVVGGGNFFRGAELQQKGMERSRAGAEILAAIERGLNRDAKTLPKVVRERRNGANIGATVELLKVLLRQVSEESGVAGKLIATVDDLEAIAASDKAEAPAVPIRRRNSPPRASCRFFF